MISIFPSPSARVSSHHVQLGSHRHKVYRRNGARKQARHAPGHNDGRSFNPGRYFNLEMSRSCFDQPPSFECMEHVGPHVQDTARAGRSGFYSPRGVFRVRRDSPVGEDAPRAFEGWPGPAWRHPFWTCAPEPVGRRLSWLGRTLRGQHLRG